jgi:predicted MFS family arabinose efflux permease
LKLISIKRRRRGRRSQDGHSNPGMRRGGAFGTGPKAAGPRPGGAAPARDFPHATNDGQGEPVESPIGASKESGASLYRYTFVIGAAAFVTTIAQTEVIGQLPIRYLLKEHLHAVPEEMSLFLFFAAIAWYLKPLAGLISDSIPLFGTRRRHYLMISAGTAGACWILLGIVPESYHWVLFVVMALNLMMVFASTAMGGMLVEQAQRFGATGRLSALREALNDLAVAIGLPVSGYLALHAIGWTSALAAGLLFGLAFCVFIFLHEERGAKRNGEVWSTAGIQLKTLLHSRALWTAGCLIFLFFVTPGLATPLYYIQIDKLGFSQPFIGWLAVVGGITGMGGAVIYARACKALPLGSLLAGGIILSAALTLLYLYYQSHKSAMIITAVNGLGGTLAVIPLYDLAARATPFGCEGLGFALIMSLRNLAVNGGDWVGSWLMQGLHWSFSGLVCISAGTTLLVLLAVPFIPVELLKGSDSS